MEKRTNLDVNFRMGIEGIVDDVKCDIEVGKFVKNPRQLGHRVLVRQLLMTARHFRFSGLRGAAAAAAAATRSLPAPLLVRTCYRYD